MIYAKNEVYERLMPSGLAVSYPRDSITRRAIPPLNPTAVGPRGPSSSRTRTRVSNDRRRWPGSRKVGGRFLQGRKDRAVGTGQNPSADTRYLGPTSSRGFSLPPGDFQARSKGPPTLEGFTFDNFVGGLPRPDVRKCHNNSPSSAPLHTHKNGPHQ